VSVRGILLDKNKIISLIATPLFSDMIAPSLSNIRKSGAISITRSNFN
jgi:uncharacterized membrane protein